MRVVLASLLAATAGCTFVHAPERIGPFVERSFSVEAGDAADADVKLVFFGGKLAVRGDDGARILALSTRDNLDRVEPRCEEQRAGSHLSVRAWIESTRRLPFDLDEEQSNQWDATLGRSVPLSLDLSQASCKSTIELGGVPIRRCELSIAAGASEVRFGARNPVEMESLRAELGAGELRLLGLGNARCGAIEVKGAAGHLELDLGGEWTRSANVRIEAGMASVEVHVPKELAVRIDASASHFAGIDVDGFTDAGDQRWTSPNAAASDVQVVLHVDASFGSVRITRD